MQIPCYEKELGGAVSVGDAAVASGDQVDEAGWITAEYPEASVLLRFHRVEVEELSHGFARRSLEGPWQMCLSQAGQGLARQKGKNDRDYNKSHPVKWRQLLRTTREFKRRAEAVEPSYARQ